MAEPSRTWVVPSGLWLPALVVALAGCGSGGVQPDASPAAQAEPPAAEESAAASEPGVTAPATAGATAEEPPPVEVLPEVSPASGASPAGGESEAGTSSDDDSVVIIETGAKDVTQQPVSLVEAARAERARRDAAPPTAIVITDKNLSEYATGELTIAETPALEAATEAELSEAEAKRAQEETYWRNGARQIRQAWSDAYERVTELEGKVFELRQQFYREDDGFYRDSEIKPAWDRAIDQLEEARAEVEARQRELVEFTERGRSAGALPGWLREGIELEPPITVEEEPSAEPSEPVIYQEGTSDPP